MMLQGHPTSGYMHRSDTGPGKVGSSVGCQGGSCHSHGSLGVWGESCCTRGPLGVQGKSYRSRGPVGDQHDSRRRRHGYLRCGQ